MLLARIALPAAIALLLSVPSLAGAARVTSAKPWAAGNEYYVESDVDGRTRAQSEPRAKIDWLKKGQWVTIQCQCRGELAYGSRIWDKVGARRAAGAGAGPRRRPSPGAALELHPRARALGGVLRAGP